MAYCRPNLKFVDIDTPIDIIDTSSKNKFRWEWLYLKDVNDEFLSNYVRKTEKDGVAWCCYCKCELKYRSGGIRALQVHAKSKCHERNRKDFRPNQCLPAVFQMTKDKIDGSAVPSTSLPYRSAPNLSEIDISRADLREAKVPSGSPPVSMRDRVSHQEALICSFIAHHNLPLSMAPHLIELAQELSNDLKALKNLHMDRQTCSYKLLYGLSHLEHLRLVRKMKTTPFSLNIDESTSKGSKKRILNILICFFCDELERSVTYLYVSIEMTIVNAETVFKAVRKQFVNDDIPFTNLISVLSDSAAYMRGSVTGFQARLKEAAPHVLDIDGDVCHHIHNSVKQFSSLIDKSSDLTRLLDDIFIDFDYRADLRDDVKEICRLLELPEQCPIQRATHRWMSIYDASVRFLEMKNVLILFYSSWLTVEERIKVKSTLASYLKGMKKESRLKIMSILQRLKTKNLTQAGKQRKRRIVEKLFTSQKYVVLVANTLVSILPLFKKFILTFERKEPMVHKLHNEITVIFRTFLSCFLTDKYVNKYKNIYRIDVKSSHVLPLERIFIGEAANKILSEMKESGDDDRSFRNTVLSAFRETAEYLRLKLPINNRDLALLSTLDPELCGHSRAVSGLQDLFDRLPTITLPNQKDSFTTAASSLQLDEKFTSTISDKTLDKWWAKVIENPKYSILSQVVKAGLSIFTGPRVKSSFCVMNQIITNTSNKLDVRIYEAIHTLKYKFLNCERDPIKFFHRDNAYTPVDQSLCYHMRTAANRMKSQKKSRILKIKNDASSQELDDINCASSSASSVPTVKRKVPMDECPLPAKKPCGDLRPFFGGMK